MVWRFIFFFAVLVPHLVSSIEDDLCVEINSRVSNRELSANMEAAKREIVRNAERPQPEVDLPVLDPGRTKLAGPYKVTGGSIEIRDITMEGFKNTKVLYTRFTGKGDTRTVYGLLYQPILKITGTYSVVGTKVSGRILAIAKDVSIPGTGIAAPKSFTHGQIRAVVNGGLEVALKPDLPLNQKDRRSLVVDLLSHEAQRLITAIDSNLLRRDCDDDQNGGRSLKTRGVDDDVVRVQGVQGGILALRKVDDDIFDLHSDEVKGEVDLDLDLDDAFD